MSEQKLKDRYCGPLNNFGLQWCEAGIGFGQLHFYIDGDTGDIKCDNECMSKEFIKQMLCQMVDDCELTEPRESLIDTK